MGGQAPPQDVSLDPGEREHLPRNPNVITHFLNSLPHPTASSRRHLSPQDPAQAWHMGEAQQQLVKGANELIYFHPRRLEASAASQETCMSLSSYLPSEPTEGT